MLSRLETQAVSSQIEDPKTPLIIFASKIPATLIPAQATLVTAVPTRASGTPTVAEAANLRALKTVLLLIAEAILVAPVATAPNPLIIDLIMYA